MLAAGRGARLKPLTNLWPKCLMPIHGAPLLSYWLHQCGKVKGASTFINTHHLACIVDEFLENNIQIENMSKISEPNLLGTGGTIINAYNLLKGRPTVIVHADNYSSIELTDFITAHEKSRSEQDIEISMGVFDCEDPKQCGICVTDERNILTEFYEKQDDPPGRKANAAVYIFESSVIDFIRKKSCVDLSIDVLPKYLNKIMTYHIDGIHRDIGTQEQLKKAQNDYKLRHSKFSMNQQHLKIFHSIMEKVASKS